MQFLKGGTLLSTKRRKNSVCETSFVKNLLRKILGFQRKIDNAGCFRKRPSPLSFVMIREIIEF